MNGGVTTGSILITGCSSGIGRDAAGTLKARGWRVFAAARSETDVAKLAADGFESVRLDYADEAGIDAALDEVLARNRGILDAVFHNGGYAQPGAIEDLPTDLLRAQFEANFFGWHELTRRVIPVMRKAGHGRLVFNSSVLGFVAGRFRGAYVASKHAVEGYADTLRVELKGTGIDVVIIEPGPIASRFRVNAIGHISESIDVAGSVHRAAYERDLAGRTEGHTRNRFRRGPEAVTAALIQALESPHPRPRYRVTFPAKAANVLKRLLTTRAMDRIVGRTRRR